MWKKPWTMKEGFAIGGGLIVAGLMLELSVGPVAWDSFRWPFNGMAMAAFFLMAMGIRLLHGHAYVFRFIATAQAAVPTLCYATGLTIIMGLTRQTANGTWLNDMLSFWPFVLIYTYMALILSQVVLRRLSMPQSFRSIRAFSALLSHLGLLVALVCATLGNADMQRLKMIVTVGEPEWRAMGARGTIAELPIAIELKQFIMEEYDDGSPRRFASDILILTQSGKKFRTTVDVNKPAKVEGWKIYQYGYDTAMGRKSRISILELVRDPWLPIVYTGIWMMLIGAVCMLLFGGRRKET